MQQQYTTWLPLHNLFTTQNVHKHLHDQDSTKFARMETTLAKDPLLMDGVQA